MLTLTRYLMALSNLLLALALVALVVLGVATGDARHPEDLFGMFWNIGFAFVAGKAATSLFKPQLLQEGLHWHKRVVVLWVFSAGVYAAIAATSTLRWGFGCGTGLPHWDDFVLFGLVALLWAAPGWLTEKLAKAMYR